MPRSTIPISTLTPQSSQIYGFGYDQARGVMNIAFKSNMDKRTYEYSNVSQEMADAAQAAADNPEGSIGSWFYRELKDRHDEFPFQKMEPDAEQGQEPQAA